MKAEINRRKNTPEMKKIGEKFMVRRKRLKISQTVVAEWLGVSQRHVSYFEEGKARLSSRQIVTLNDKLAATEKGAPTQIPPKPLNLLSAIDFLQIITETKESDVADVWLFGPEKSAIFLDRALKDSWTACVDTGATLHVVWRLDVKMEKYAMRLFSGVAARIICDLTRSSSPPSEIGSIDIYAIRGANQGYGGNAESYRDLQDHFKQELFSGRVKVHDPVDISSEKFDRFHSLLDLGRFGPVLAYSGKSNTPGVLVSPIAVGVMIEHVSLKPHTCADISFEGMREIAESGWVFLATDDM